LLADAQGLAWSHDGGSVLVATPTCSIYDFTGPTYCVAQDFDLIGLDGSTVRRLTSTDALGQLTHDSRPPIGWASWVSQP
jgi:hypothetical protein